MALQVAGQSDGECCRSGEQPLLQQQGDQVGPACHVRAGQAPADVDEVRHQAVALPLRIGVADLDCPVDPPGEARRAVAFADVVLQPPDHHLADRGRVRLHSWGEALRVQHRQQRLPGPRVPVVRCGGQEQPVLAVVARAVHCLGLLARDRDSAGTRRNRRRAMVGLVDDEEVEIAWVTGFGREHLVQQPLQPRGSQPLQADDRARVYGERVGLQSVGSAQLPQRGGIQDREVQAELGGHLIAPFQGQRGWADDEDPPGSVPQQHLLDHQAGFDRLAQPDVVGDQQVHPWHR